MLTDILIQKCLFVTPVLFHPIFLRRIVQVSPHASIYRSIRNKYIRSEIAIGKN